MAISTMDQLVAALSTTQRQNILKGAGPTAKAAGAFLSLWTQPGMPGSGVKQGTTTGATCDNTTAGGMNFTAPGGGNTLYVARGGLTASNQCTVIVYDRIWHDSGLSGVLTSAQTVGSPATTPHWPVGAQNIEAFLEVYTALGSTAVTATVSYTNSAGVAGRTGTVTIPATATVGQMLPMSLQQGDTSVRSIESVTLSGSTGTAGDFGFTLARRLAEFPVIVGSSTPAPLDFAGLGFPQVPANACLALMVLANVATTYQVVGSLDLVQG